METYGWTITEVKSQPYFELLNLLKPTEQDEKKAENKSSKMYTGQDLKYLFGGQKGGKNQ